MARPPSFSHSNIVVIASNSILSLFPSTLIAQVESLLDSHRIQDAANLADQQRKKFQVKATVEQDETDELYYVYQRIGFQCLIETMFEDAGRYLLAGNLDPRIIVSYFPDLCGSLISKTDSVNMFTGIADHLPKASSINDLILNYSPHLAPNTKVAPPTVELRKILNDASVDMLESFLCQYRAKRHIAPDSDKISAVVDTVYAKLLVRSEKTTQLHLLLDGPNNIVLDEVEPVLTQYGRYSALRKMYQQLSEHEKLLQALSKLVDGEWTDDDVHDPLADMFTLLTEKRDRAMTQRWGVWLTRKDPQRAIKLLTTRESNKRTRVEDDLALLHQIREANPEAGTQFLEYLVLQKRTMDPKLHMELATSCLDQLFTYLSDDSVSKLWRAKAASYSKSHSRSSFLSYFASTTPDSRHKHMRLKTILFLQGSVYLNLDIISTRIQQQRNILQLEYAIIEGKLGRHRSALTILVDELHDEASAEAYCTLGGQVVPPKIVQSIGENYDLRQWTSILPTPATGSKAKPIPMDTMTKSADGRLQKTLLMTLLEVYMSAGEASAERTARLLGAQAINLDVLEVVPSIPPDWSLGVMSSFLARSFRSLLHTRHEGQIVKAISAGQNLEIADKVWPILREQGAIIEEAIDEDGSGDGEEKKPLPALPDTAGEPESLDEKANEFPRRFNHVVEIRPGGDTDSVPVDDFIAFPSSVDSKLR